MKWLLIYWIVTWGGSAGLKPSTGVAEFTDQPACQVALSAIQEKAPADGMGDKASGVCVANGSQP